MHLRSRSAFLVFPTLLASIAFAQSSTTSTSTSSNTTTTTTAPAATTATPQNAPTAPTTTTTAPAATAPNAVVQPPRPVTPPAGNTPPVPSTAVNPLAPNLPPASSAAQTIVNSTTAAPGTALALEPSNINELAAAGLDAALNPTAALTTLRTAPVASQQTVVRALQTRVDATTRALLDLRARARANGIAGAGPNFDQAAEDIRLRETALRDALSSAGGTTDEAAWRQAQTQIATLYQAYADSVQRARALLQSPPQP